MNAENMYTASNQSVAVNWRWRKDGDITTIPRALYGYGYNWLGSDRYVEDGSFLRFKYLTFAYNVPKKPLKKLHLDRVSAYMTLNNLLVLSCTLNIPEAASATVALFNVRTTFYILFATCNIVTGKQIGRAHV